jgi:hypothetical protein
MGMRVALVTIATLALSTLPAVGAIAESGAAWNDYNGDGYADLAVGVPWETINAKNGAGAVNVLYGSAGGITAVGDQLLSQRGNDVPGVPEHDDFFGSSLASGNFNGDAYGDLAVGVGGQDVDGIKNAGQVQVFYGSADGLQKVGSQILSQGTPGVLDDPEVGDVMGETDMAAGDFNADGSVDLFVSVAFEDLGAIANAGAANVFYGSPTGLTVEGNQFWSDDNDGGQGGAVAQEGFGAATGSGDFDRDGYADVATGYDDMVGAAGFAGAVHVLYGSETGLDAGRAQVWTQDSPDIKGRAEQADEFGLTLATGDFDGDGYDDLGVGVQQESMAGGTRAGAVAIIYGSQDGLAAERNQLWSQESPGIPDRSEKQDQFGGALVAGNFGRGPQTDLAIGTPLESVGDVALSGSVTILYGSSAGIQARGSQEWTQNAPGVADTAEVGDEFGYTLSAANFGGSKSADLAIGVWHEYLGSIGAAGAVHVLYSSSTGLTSTSSQFWTQDSPGVHDQSETGDSFSLSLG